MTFLISIHSFMVQYIHDAQMLARLNALGIVPNLFRTFEQATLLLNFLEPQPERHNRLPTNDLLLGNESVTKIAFGILHSLLLTTVGRRRRKLIDDELTCNEVLMQIRLC